MKKQLIVLGIKLLLLFPVLFLYSCHSSDENTSGNIPATDTVIIQQMQFIPAVLHVKSGDTVIWINKDMVDHTVLEQKNKAFYSDTIHVGESWKMAVKDSADYVCSIHPSMIGKLEIK